jgi:imidazolonepropionase-like amidohydrolase/glyoxylase-like metal-dependent hydrolase (beta-lactamase superfamily II)
MVQAVLRGAAAVLVIAVPGAAAAQQPAAASRSALAAGVTAIMGVSVIPMTRDTVLRDQTVLVRDGRIADVGPSGRVRVPQGARRIDGRGRYLVPGLADMHTHLFSDDQVHDSAGAAELGVMLATGLTAVRLMIGTPEHLALRREVEAGRVAGPQLFIASPQFTGAAGDNASVVRTADEARAAVNAAAAAGYDYIKLTTQITPEVFDAVVAAARERRIPVIGHVDPRVGVTRALAAGQHVEHLDNYLESVLADSAPSRVSVSDVGLFAIRNWETLDHVDEAKVARLAGATARSRTFTTPTLNMFRSAFGLGQSDAELRARPDWDHMPPSWRRGYLTARQRFWSNPPTAARRARYVAVRGALVKAIADSGGRIMAGSDSPEWFHVYGFALHRELEALVAAGLTPFQALQAATVHPAAFFGASVEFGTVERGRRADLLLLDANPLEDIRHTTRIRAVLIGGRVIERAELDAMLERGSRAIGGRAPDSLRVLGPGIMRSLATPGAARVEELARGVYAVVRPEPIGLANNGNSLIIVGDSDVVVVDAQFTRLATLETIAAIRQVTALPVGAVITTHWHDDHAAGNQVYRDSFPTVRFIAHASTAADFATQGLPNRAGTVQGAQPLVDRYARLLQAGLGVDSTAVSPAERASLTSALRIMRQYLAEAPGLRFEPFTDSLASRLTLRRGGRIIDVRWFGCANTRGDLVIHLPEEGIVATGDLLVHPVPFAFGSYPASWAAVLDSVAGLAPRIVLPGHGPVMRDLAYLRSVQGLLGAVQRQVAPPAQRGDSLAAVLRAVTLDEERRRVTGGEKWLGWMFTNFFLAPSVSRAWRLARPGAAAPGCG